MLFSNFSGLTREATKGLLLSESEMKPQDLFSALVAVLFFTLNSTLSNLTLFKENHKSAVSDVIALYVWPYSTYILESMTLLS